MSGVGTVTQHSKVSKNKNGAATTDHVIVVGIGGPTRSGKTTLATSLSKHFNKCTSTATITPQFRITCTCIIHLDRFLKPKLPLVRVGTKQYYNYETPFAHNFMLLRECILSRKKALQQHQCASGTSHCVKFLFVEGFLLFSPACAKFITDLLNIKLFVKVSKHVAFIRRMSTTKVPVDYFHKVVWPHYLKYGQVPEQKGADSTASTDNNNDIVSVFDGEKDKSIILQQAIEVIVKYCKKSHNKIIL